MRCETEEEPLKVAFDLSAVVPEAGVLGERFRLPSRPSAAGLSAVSSAVVSEAEVSEADKPAAFVPGWSAPLTTAGTPSTVRQAHRRQFDNLTVCKVPSTKLLRQSQDSTGQERGARIDDDSLLTNSFRKPWCY